MDGSPSSVLTLGLGTWGSPGLLLTLGLGVGEESPVTLVGYWQDVERISAARERVSINADRSRIEVRG